MPTIVLVSVKDRHIFINFLSLHPHSHSAPIFHLHIHQSKINFLLVALSQGLHSERDKSSKSPPFGFFPKTQSERGRNYSPGNTVNNIIVTVYSNYGARWVLGLSIGR